MHEPTRRAFTDAAGLLQFGESDRLILDSGCGTGASTRRLAERFPGHTVIGIDRSAKRLVVSGAPAFPFREGNLILVRAEMASFWRLAHAAGWRLSRHFLLYPNPWPKPGQMGRRWHAHPVFPVLIALGGEIEMRCNWRVYAEEFALAAGWVTGREINVGPLVVSRALSPFEAKYHDSGHGLYRVGVPAI